VLISAERGGAAYHAYLALPVAPATHQPALGDTQGNMSRQLAGAVVWGGWSSTSAATRGQRAALLRFFNSSGLVKRAVPRPCSGGPPEGLTGMAELRRLFPGGAGGAKPLLPRASFVVPHRPRAAPARQPRAAGPSRQEILRPSCPLSKGPLLLECEYGFACASRGGYRHRRSSAGRRQL
jgi:hypothetical protein